MSTISIKGMRDGIVLIIPPTSEPSDIEQQVQERVASAPGLFEGAKVVLDFSGQMPSPALYDAAAEVLKGAGVDEITVHKEPRVSKKSTPQSSDDLYQSPQDVARLIKGTVRSGQQLSFAGDVVIMGDVNPGAEVIAKGNIVIFGALRGVAHAGARGDHKSFVAAMSLEPTQVRIAGLVARSPDNEKSNVKRGPEVVFIKDDELVIEPYSAGLRCLQ